MNESDSKPNHEFVSKSEAATTALGKAIGEVLQPGMVIGLIGTLGSGKTRLTQAIGSSLGVDQNDIVSPTFTICVPYEGRLAFLHLDAYRIGQPQEVDELGLDELSDNGVVLIVEWADRVRKLLPPIDVEISIATAENDSRLFRFDSFTEQGCQLVETLFANLD